MKNGPDAARFLGIPVLSVEAVEPPPVLTAEEKHHLLALDLLNTYPLAASPMPDHSKFPAATFSPKEQVLIDTLRNKG